MKPNTTLSLLVAGALWLSSCATSQSVVVVEESPVGCKPLGEVGVVLPNGGDQAESIEQLRLKARRKGANTMACCWEGPEGHFIGTNKSTGKDMAVDGVVLSGWAYTCESQLKK